MKGLLPLKKYWLVALALLGVLLMLLPSLIPEEEESGERETENEEIMYYSEKIEEKIEKLISSAKGVGKASVAVTLDCSNELVLAQNENFGDSSYSADYVIINSSEGEEGVLIKEIYPKIRGVAVVCDGGESIDVKKRVTELICAALGISSNKIAVSG